MWRIKTSRQSGFTLVEVVVALAIASSALVLLLSANRNSLVRSIRTHEKDRLKQAIDTKLGEILCGVETSKHGTFENLAGYTWLVNEQPGGVERLDKLEKVSL